jgi:hypothetical protein
MRLFALLLALAAAACASRPTPRPEPVVPGALRIAEVAVPESARAFFLTVYPTPRRMEYGGTLLPLAGAVFVDDASPDFDARLRAAGLDLGWKDLRREGYLVAVTAEAGHAVVVKAARDDAGRRWADEALAQVTYESGKGRFVRVCRILDEPVFALRGNKRPQAWETKYRANFAWGAKDDPDFRGRTMTAVYAPAMPFDASGAAVARALDYFRPWQDRGVRLFAVKFDDVGFAVTPESELRHGPFPAAFTAWMHLVRQGLRRRDADARLYLLPQTYWWDDPRMVPFAEAIRRAGGLDEDVGLVFTGPEIVSQEIEGAGLAWARRVFGLTETKALVYDNLGREGDWGPLVGREASLARSAEGVFGERGTPVTRLTRLDWLWNPDDYDPEKSWRRAVFELAGPADFERFEAVCRAFREGAGKDELAPMVDAFAASASSWKGPVPRRDLVALLRADCARAPRAATASREPAN